MYKDDTAITHTVTIGEIAEIEILKKQGSYFVGAYDAKEGETKYFDGRD